MTKDTSRKATPRLRILLGRAIAIGPGKAELLRLIDTTGSIAAAAREMGMSYRRAWTLVETMNTTFRQTVVEAVSGGRGGGGARITDFGREVLACYQAMEAKTIKNVAPEMETFVEMLDPDYSESDD